MPAMKECFSVAPQTPQDYIFLYIDKGEANPIFSREFTWSMELKISQTVTLFSMFFEDF